jgi:hypothetical protein
MNLFSPRLASRSIKEIDHIAGSKQSTSWPTFSSETWVRQISEQVALEEAHSRGNFADLEHAWLSCLLEEGMLVRRVGSPTWLLSLGSLGAAMAVGWPMIEIADEVGTVFTLDTSVTQDSLQFMVVLSDDQWEAQPLTWESPLSHMIRKGSPACALGIHARPLGDKTTLLKSAAEACFWKFGVGQLNALLEYLGIEAAANTLTDKLTALIKYCLDPISDARVLEILEMRLLKDSESSQLCELLQRDFMHEMMPASDGKEADKIMLDVKKANETMTDFEKDSWNQPGCSQVCE